MAKMEAAMLYGSVRDRFCRAEREGWFSPGAKTTRHPLTAAGEALEPAPNGDSLYREAAVLALMGCCSQDEDDPNQLQILITKRSTEISSHPGKTIWLRGSVAIRSVALRIIAAQASTVCLVE